MTPRATIARYRGVVIDVTERRLAEAALLEREQSYSAIFLESPFAIALSRMPENIIVDVNKAFLDFIGGERDEVIGRTSVELGIADAGSRQRVADEFRARGFVRDFEVSRTTLSGEQRLVSLSITPVSIAGRSTCSRSCATSRSRGGRSRRSRRVAPSSTRPCRA